MKLHHRQAQLLEIIQETAGNIKRSYKDSYFWNKVHETSPSGQQQFKSPSAIIKEIGIFAFHPLVNQMSNYSTKLFIHDLMASFTNSLMLIAGSLAYSALAGLPIIHGLMSCVVHVAVYALIGGSRQLSVGKFQEYSLNLGPEVLTSILTGLIVHRELMLYQSDPSQTAAILGFMVGIVCIITSILRAGFIDNLIGGFMLTGFITGVSFLIMSVQLPILFGLPIGNRGDFPTVYKFSMVFSNIHLINIPSLLVGLLSFVILNVLILINYNLVKNGYKWANRFPPVIILMAISITASAICDFNQYNVGIVGHFDQKIPTPRLPLIDSDLAGRLFTDVIMLCLVGFIEIQSVTRIFSLKHGYTYTGDRELFAIGAANLVGSFFGGYPSFGSLPRSRILNNSGARTNLAGLLSVPLLICIILSLHPILYYLPKPTLAAIIFNGAIGLIKFKEIIFIFKSGSWSEVFMFAATLTITFTTSVSNGILFCLLLAVLIITRKVTVPDISIMGRMDLDNNLHDSAYFDIKEYPNAQVLEGILPLSIRGRLLFYNSSNIAKTINGLMKIDRQLLHEQHLLDCESEEYCGAGDTVGSRDTLFMSYNQQRSTDADLSISVESSSAMNEIPMRPLNRTNSFDPFRQSYALILDFTKCSDMDTAACLVLHQTIISLRQEHKIRIILSGLHPFHKILFKTSGILELLEKDVFCTLESAIKDVNDQRNMD